MSEDWATDREQTQKRATIPVWGGGVSVPESAAWQPDQGQRDGLLQDARVAVQGRRFDNVLTCARTKGLGATRARFGGGAVTISHFPSTPG